MGPARQDVPAEHPQPEEGRLEEERCEAFHRERRPEHVADELRVGRPVHSELELLHEAGHHPDCDREQHEPTEELRELAVVVLAGAIPLRVQDGDQEAEADRHRYEQEVVDARRRELDPREVELAH